MKRHAALQSLSREHHPALVLALACKRAAQSGDMERIRETSARVERIFAAELEPHFRVEEETLLPLLNQAGQTALVQRTVDEHVAIRALLRMLRSPDGACLAKFGQALSDHVRFEEQVLFPAAEEAVPGAVLEATFGLPPRQANLPA